MVRNIKYIFFVVILFYSCINFKLSLKKVPYKGNEIKINGYYYVKTYIGTEKKLYANVFFLYSNGVIINTGGYRINEDEEKFRKNIINGYNISVTKKYQYNYGLFQINDSIIKVEKWVTGNGGIPKSIFKQGKIINDTTFYLMYKKKKEIYHFKQFSPKPDSTNRFIK